jgi:hypothetical protein
MEKMITNNTALIAELLEIVAFINEHRKGGSQQVYFGALATDDDETTLGELVERVIAKARGES